MSIQKFANAMGIIGLQINSLPKNKLELSIVRLNELYNKLLSSKPNAIEIGGLARCLVFTAQDVQSSAQEIATLSSIKEQHDHAVQTAKQSTENFLAAIEGRFPEKIK